MRKISFVFISLFVISCGIPDGHPDEPVSEPVGVLLKLSEINLPYNVYELIKNHGSATISQKNAIMTAVKAAMDAVSKDQAVRDASIDSAVALNGDHPNLAEDIQAQVNIADPIYGTALLFTKDQSGLLQNVYDVIKSHGSATIRQKNAIMTAVKFAMDKEPKNQVIRNIDIKLAVTLNGDYPNFAAAIQAQVDKADPIVVPEQLLTWVQSGLPVAVYDVIAAHGSATTSQKNAIMTAVKVAMARVPKSQGRRDADIDSAVSNNGNFPNLAKAIKAKVDTADPVPVVAILLTELQSGLPKNLYDVIAGHASATNNQKNALMTAVKAAISKSNKYQFERDGEIELAVLRHANFPGLAKRIKDEANLADPFLTTEKNSGLPKYVYEAIASHGAATIHQKNALMTAVKAAMVQAPKDKVSRDAKIDKAVSDNGNYPGLAFSIKFWVDGAL